MKNHKLSKLETKMMNALAILDHYRISAEECARYIFDSDSEQVSYQEFVQDGRDPREHILYHAAVVLGKDIDFKEDIDEYLGIEND